MFFSSCRPAKTNSRFFKLCRAERSSSRPRFLDEETKMYRFHGRNCSYPTFEEGTVFMLVGWDFNQRVFMEGKGEGRSANLKAALAFLQAHEIP